MNNVIRKPKVYLYLGLSGILYASFFCWTFYLGITQSIENFAYSAVFGIFTLIFLYVFLLRINWKIEINKNKIIYRNVFRKEYVYKNDELTLVHKLKKRTIEFFIYYNNKKIIKFSIYEENVEIIGKFKNHKIIDCTEDV